MISISKIYLPYLVCGILLLLSENLPGINYISLFLVFFSIIYFYVVDKLKQSLFLLLLFSAISQNGLNIFTFSISGLSFFYIICISLLLILLFQRINNRCYIFSKVSFLYLSLILFNFCFTAFNFFDITVFFLKDFLIIVFLPVTFFILFKRMSNRDIFFIFYNLIAIKVIVSFILYISGFTLRMDENLHDAMVVDNADELSAFFTILLLSCFLFLKRFNKFWLNIIFFVTCLGVISYGLGFVGLGSQVVIMLLLVIILYIYKRKLVFLFIFPILFLLYPVIDISNNELLVYKLGNIAGLIDNLNKDSIYLIPHSPQVRVVELINIFSYPWYNVMFGHGLGGYFTDNYFAFNKYIGKFDFSEYEIMTRRFYNPHNIAYGVLKLGIIWWFFIAYLFYTAIKVKDNEVRVFLLVATFVLFLNFGYAIKTSILLALVFIIIHNYKKALVCETKNKFH